MKEFLPN